MLLMSGYTMDFFFPKQAKHPSAETREDVAAKSVVATPGKAATPPMADALERTEVPAFYYFFRYF